MEEEIVVLYALVIMFTISIVGGLTTKQPGVFGFLGVLVSKLKELILEK